MIQLLLLISISVSLLPTNIRRPNPHCFTTSKKKGVMKSKDVGLNSKASKGKQVISYDFEFVDVAEEDPVIIFLIYVLECCLLKKLKNLFVCRRALLLVGDLYKFNSYLWSDIVFNLLFDNLNKYYVHMRNVALEMDQKKKKTKLTIGSIFKYVDLV